MKACYLYDTGFLFLNMGAIVSNIPFHIFRHQMPDARHQIGARLWGYKVARKGSILEYAYKARACIV
jgi:hypothetical protein